MLTLPLGTRARIHSARPSLRLASALVVLLPAPAQADDDALRAALAAERNRPVSERFERAEFLARPAVRNPRLSPDGRLVAYLHQVGSHRGLWLLATTGGEPRRLLADTDATDLEWSRDGRWLFLDSPHRLSALAVDGQAGTGVLSSLRGRDPRRWLGIDRSRPAAVLIGESVAQPDAARAAPRRHRLWRMAPGASPELLWTSSRPLLGAALDGQGRLAFLSLAEGAEHLIVRVAEGGRLQELARCTPIVRSGCSLLGATLDGHAAWLKTYLGGDTVALARLDDDGILERLHADPQGIADLDEVTLDPVTGEPQIATYRSTVAHSHGLGSEIAGHLATITRQLADRDLRFQLAHGPTVRWLISERSGDQQGERFHLYDPGSRRLEPILATQQTATVPADQLARKLPFTYGASDGRRIHGFLLVPPGRDFTEVPLIAQVHGGPWSQIGIGFDSVAQELVNRGYAVFQPNFRGSTGLGRQYLLAGGDDFGNGRVQQDIVDGVRYLLRRGIGNPERVGILGGSFGGYSTLLGVTFEPELFKVGVALVPPSDFAWILRWNGRQSDVALAAAVPLNESLRALGIDPDDPATMDRLHRESPLAAASQLRRPVLLMAGGEDERVAIRSVTHYAATLQALGKDVSFYVEADAGHSVDDELSREAHLYLIEAMFHRHLGGALPKPPSRELRRRLERDLRLVGESLRAEALDGRGDPRPPNLRPERW